MHPCVEGRQTQTTFQLQKRQSHCWVQARFFTTSGFRFARDSQVVSEKVYDILDTALWYLKCSTTRTKQDPLEVVHLHVNPESIIVGRMTVPKQF
jgi:hypothetical protein